MDVGNSPSNGADGTWAPGYQVTRSLHRSDYTQIFAAVRLTSGIEAAVKVVAKPERAHREINALRTLADAPGVIPLLDAGRTTMGHEFIVLPLHTDGSLGQVLGRNGPRPLPQTVAVGRSVGSALANLHSKGLLHNAVAPENILSGSTSLLTGFSSVVRAGKQGVPVRSSESFLHAPPEAFRGEQLVPSSDVYRLASTLWTLLMGRTPFSSEEGTPLDNEAYMERVLSMNAPVVGRRDVSRVLSRVLTRAMAKAPEDRYQNASEFALALERARTGTTGTGGGPESTGVRPPGTAVAPVQAFSEPPEGHVHPPVPQPQDLEETPGPDPTAIREAPAVPEPGHAPSEAEVEHRGAGFDAGTEPDKPVEGDPEEEISHAEEPPPPTQRPPSTATIGSIPSQWNALEGWAGDADTRLPGGETDRTDVQEDDPVWNDLDDEPRWRKHLNIAVAAAGALLFTGATGVVMVMQPGLDGSALVSATESADEGAVQTEEEDIGGTTPVEPSPPPALDVPTEVALDDNGDSVTVDWVDNSGGTASYFVLGGQQEHDPMTVARTGPGAVTTEVNTEAPNSEYCFTVIAVDGTAAPSDEVCTTRAADRAEAERQAEEEAEEEEREAEEEDEEADDENGSSGGSGSGGSGSGSSGSDSEDSGGGGSDSGGSGSSGSGD